VENKINQRIESTGQGIKSKNKHRNPKIMKVIEEAMEMDKEGPEG
jgi:hypothetical protein